MLLLSLHSLIEGAAIGIPENLSESLLIFIAVFAHKGAESFALGYHLKHLGLNISLARVLVGVFSLVTPLGILLTAWLPQYLTCGARQSFLAIFNAITSGTFLYLSTEHMIEGGKSYSQHLELISLLLGITIMTILALV